MEREREERSKGGRHTHKRRIKENKRKATESVVAVYLLNFECLQQRLGLSYLSVYVCLHRFLAWVSHPHKRKLVSSLPVPRKNSTRRPIDELSCSHMPPPHTHPCPPSLPPSLSPPHKGGKRASAQSIEGPDIMGRRVRGARGRPLGVKRPEVVGLRRVERGGVSV